MSEIMVLGAGMVGVCSAIELQARGHTVTLVDRAVPGSETSHGNAGIIQAEAAEPYALPREPRVLLEIILGRTNDVTWSLAGVLTMAIPLLQYFKCSAPGRHALISKTYSQLTARATDDHAVLIKAAKAGSLISEQGLVDLYRSDRKLEKSAEDLIRLEREYGVTSRVLDSEAYAKEEPAIKGPVAGAIHWPQSWSCSDPRALTQQYAELFSARGGRIEKADARHIRRQGSAWTLKLDSEQVLTAEHTVVALGPWSAQFLRAFGYRVPMILKRGYHTHFTNTTPVSRPFLDVEYGVVATSVSQGLRVTSGVALVRHNASTALSQLRRGTKGLSEIIELGPPVNEPAWLGTRPCIPDMLPLVGAAPQHSHLWFNFGHGHQGFTLGPTTAHYLADAVEGIQSAVGTALAPCDRVR